VTDQSGPLPQRIGDAERDKATQYLRDHLAEGRLDETEFDERLTKALTARTQADLDPLFTDLPGPKPGHEVVPSGTFQAPPWQASPSQDVAPRPSAPVPVQSKFNSAWAIAAGIAWPAAIIACFATDWKFWWIMMIPIFFPWWMRAGHGGGHPDHGRDRHRRS
jgi:hypothetical protein